MQRNIDPQPRKKEEGYSVGKEKNEKTPIEKIRRFDRALVNILLNIALSMLTTLIFLEKLGLI